MSFAVWLSALKWSLLLRGLGYELSVLRSLRALLAAWPFAAVTPSRAGDFVRAVLVRDKIPLVAGHTSVFVDRLLDIQSLAILATVGILYFFHPAWGIAAIAIAISIWASLFYWLSKKASAPRWIPSRFATILLEVHKILAQLRAEKKALTLNALCSLATWCCVQWVFVGLAWAFGLTLDWREGMFLWPMATLIGLVPITLAGMGTRDLAFIAVLLLARQQSSWGSSLAYDVQQEVAKNASWFLATVSYTAVSSWLFAMIGLPLTILDVLNKQTNRRTSPPNAAKPPG